MFHLERDNFKLVFRALRNRNYRLFVSGQSISLVGTWMQQIAMSWMVYRLTGSALMLGVVGFFGQVPAFFLMPFAGVIADRHNRRRILIVTQTLAMLQAAILAALVLSGRVQVWHIIVLSIVLGVINSLDMPVRQAFTIEMVEKKEDLANAIALNSSMVNLAKLAGPSIAGIVIAVTGEGVCFLLNAVSYSAVIFSLAGMKIDVAEVKARHPRVLSGLKEGLVYAYNFMPIKYILMILGLVSLAGAPYMVLMPVFAKDIFHGGPETLGFLASMSGIGALAGTIYLAGRRSVIGLGRVIALASGVFGLAIMVFAGSRILWFSMMVACVSGFAMIIQMAAGNTILQMIVDDDKRGRVMSLYTMAFIGMAPFGSLLAGSLAAKIGAPNTLFFGGVCCITGSLVFFWKLPFIRKKIHPVYVKKGIIPEVAEGLASASGLEVLSESK